MTIQFDQLNNQLKVSDLANTNAPLVIQSQGTGALQAQLADGTTTGGNARGPYAVDWQRIRTNALYVAGGYGNVIGGGASNQGTAGAVIAYPYNNLAVTASATIYLLPNSTSSIKIGQLITGTGIPANTFVQSTSGFPVAVAGAALTTGAISGSTLTFASSTGATVVVGMVLSGGTVTNGTYIVSGSGLSWTVNISQTATVTTATLYTITVSQPVTLSAITPLFTYNPYGTVAGGSYNTASGILSFVGGGGDSSQFYFGNGALGDYSTVVGGTACGTSDTGTYGFVGGGSTNKVTANYGVVVGGNNNTASGAYSAILGGIYGTTRGITGYIAFPACQNPLNYGQGLSQGGLLVLGRVTIDATPGVLISQIFGSVSATTQIALPDNSAYYFKARVIAGVTGAGDTKAWTLEGAIKRGAGVATTAIVGTVTTTVVAADAGASTWTVTATADTTNGALKLTATGAAGVTIRWVAKVETTEMTY